MDKQTNMGVYKIENVKNGKIYYGSSIDVKKRWKQHKKELKKGTHHSPRLLEDWNRYAPDFFEFEIVEKHTDEKRMREREKRFILKGNTINSDSGYNMTDNTEWLNLEQRMQKERVDIAKKLKFLRDYEYKREQLCYETKELNKNLNLGKKALRRKEKYLDYSQKVKGRKRKLENVEIELRRCRENKRPELVVHGELKKIHEKILRIDKRFYKLLGEKTLEKKIEELQNRDQHLRKKIKIVYADEHAAVIQQLNNSEDAQVPQWKMKSRRWNLGYNREHRARMLGAFTEGKKFYG